MEIDSEKLCDVQKNTLHDEKLAMSIHTACDSQPALSASLPGKPEQNRDGPMRIEHSSKF